jgi:hypothetical protein
LSAPVDLVSNGPDGAPFGHQNDTARTQTPCDLPTPLSHDPVENACQRTRRFGTRECAAFRYGIFHRHPSLAETLGRHYASIATRQSYVAANTWLREKNEDLYTGKLKLTGSPKSVQQYAKSMAKQCAAKRQREGNLPAWCAGKELATEHRLNIVLRGGKSIETELARLTQERWWTSQLVRLKNQTIENTLHQVGSVNLKNGRYCSERAARLFDLRQVSTMQYLSEKKIYNDSGQSYSLLQLYEKSVSNPAIRRTELMVRIRGVEEESQALGDTGVFITMTTPSRFHAYSTKGKPNPKFDSSSPADAQAYLNHRWGLIRSAYGKLSIAPYGFRIVEPHHDGTPHWHLLLFVPRGQLGALKAVFKKYLFKNESRHYIKHGLKMEEIDPAKGSAAGYIAKYISKNIDGRHLEADLYGKDAGESARRIRAWASLWHIRQFTAIGQPSVTVYRELRRLREEVAGDLELARAAADQGEWRDYIKFMGGLNLPRALRPIQAFKVHAESVDPSTGEVITSVSEKIRGLVFAGQTFITRTRNWSDSPPLSPLCRRGFQVSPEALPEIRPG